MVDESGLELSLGLSFGESSSKSKVKDATSDPKNDEGDGSQLMGCNMTISDDLLKNFFKSGPENHDPKGKQKSDSIAYRHGSFFTDLSNCSSLIADCSNDAQSTFQLAKYQDLWMPSNRTLDIKEERSGSFKRKLPFEDIYFQNKPEKLIDNVDKLGKVSAEAPYVRNSYVSITKEDGSTGVNDDVAESEAGGLCLSSWLCLQREEKEKCSETFNSNGFPTESSRIGLQDQKEPRLSGKEPNPDFRKVAFEVPLSLQPLPVMTGTYPASSVMSSATSGPNATCISSTRVMQLMPNVNGERPIVPSNINNMQCALSHPSAPLPTMEKGSSWAFNSRPLHVSSFNSRKQSAGIQNQEHFEDSLKTSQGSAAHNAPGLLLHDRESSELTIGINKYFGEVGASSQADGSKLRSHTTTSNEVTDKLTVEAISREKPDVRSGIAPYLEFGGYQDLPWVSTAGQGSNGKTVTGVTYKYNQNEIKVVCACHGILMSQEEFVQHAGGDSLNSQNNSKHISQ